MTSICMTWALCNALSHTDGWILPDFSLHAPLNIMTPNEKIAAPNVPYKKCSTFLKIRNMIFS